MSVKMMMPWSWCSSRIALLLLVVHSSVNVCSVAHCSTPAPAFLQPKTYTSPSAEYVLTVNPSDMYGRGDGRYRVTKSAIEVWSGKLPFTLWDAEITNSGVVAGYAYSLGMGGGPRWVCGALHFVVIDANGEIRLNKRTERRFSSIYLHPKPMVDGLIVHECHDRLFFRVSGWWWVYQLSTGFELGRLDPKRLMPDSENDRAVWDAQPVAGTPLTLVHWYRTDGEQPATRSPGARFTLVDLKGRTVWSLKLNRDYNLAFKDFRLRRVIHKQGAILCTGQASRFELHFVADAQRVTFSVKPEPTGNWAVAEVAREPLTLSDRILKPPEIPQRPLKSLGTLVLRLKKKRPTSLIRGVLGLVFGARGKLASLTIDRHGRFYAVDGRTAAVHVFDPRGKFLHVCKPACTDVFGVGGNRVISVTDRSEVFLNLDDDRYIRFSAKGARLGSKRLKTDRWYSLPGTTNGLALGYREAYFVDAEGKTIRTIRRGADGNWLIYPDCAAVAPNGSFAIVAASGTVTNVNGRTVHLYDATGNPIRSTPLHASLCYYTDIAFDGTHLVVCGPEADRDEAAERVLVMDAAGSPLISFIPESSEQTSWQPYLLPNGRELVLFDGESGALQRYALP